MSMVFGGGGDEATKVNPSGSPIILDAWTWGAIIKPTTISTDGNGIMTLGPDAGTSASGRGYIFFFDGGGHLRVRGAGEQTIGATALSAGTWYRVGATRAGSGVAHIGTYLNGVQDSDDNVDPPTEITAGDALTWGTGDGGLSVANFIGSIAWGFVLQGVKLSAAAIDDYLNSTGGKTPCSLLTDYGAAGSIVPHALKGLWGMGLGSPEPDFSEYANDLTRTGTSSGAMPPGAPATCAAGIGFDEDYQLWLPVQATW